MKKKGQRNFNNENVHIIKMLALPRHPLYSSWLLTSFISAEKLMTAHPLPKAPPQVRQNVSPLRVCQQGSFLHEHARPLNMRCTRRLTTGFAFIKMARLKAIIAIILLVGLGEFARDLTKCVVCKKNSNTVLTKAK